MTPAEDAHRLWIQRLWVQYDLMERVAASRLTDEWGDPTLELGGWDAAEDYPIPVYRSVHSPSAEDVELNFEEPVFRGLSTPDPQEALDEMRARASVEGPDSVEAIWLTRMPPLIRRQNACIGF